MNINDESITQFLSKKLLNPNNNETYLRDIVRRNIKLVPRFDLMHLVIVAATKGYLSVVKLLVKFGARITKQVIRLVDETKNKKMSTLLQIIMGIQEAHNTSEDIENIYFEFNNIHFDLLCTMFEDPSERRDKNIIHLLRRGADPSAFGGAALSRVLNTEYYLDDAFERLSAKMLKVSTPNGLAKTVRRNRTFIVRSVKN